MTCNHRYLSRRAKPPINRSLTEKVQNTIDNMKQLKNEKCYGSMKWLNTGGFNKMEAYKQEFIEFMLA